MIETTDPIQQEQNRAQIYWLFSSLLSSEMSEDSIQSLAHGEGRAFFEGLTQVPTLNASATALLSAIDQQLTQPDAVLALRADFTTSFLLDAKTSAPPYASIYCSDQQQLFQQPHLDMQALLAQCGLTVADQVNEPADHLAIQLDYLGNLIIQRLNAPLEHAEAGLQQQADFIDQHLLNWLPKLIQRMEKIAISAFYLALLQLLLAFLKTDRDSLI